MITTDTATSPVDVFPEIAVDEADSSPVLRRPGHEARQGTGRSGRFRRTIVSLALATASFFAVGLGGAAPASAEGMSFTFGGAGGGCERQFYGWDVGTYWNGYNWVSELVTVELPCVGGGAYYCWYYSGGCWWEQWPHRRY